MIVQRCDRCNQDLKDNEQLVTVTARVQRDPDDDEILHADVCSPCAGDLQRFTKAWVANKK